MRWPWRKSSDSAVTPALARTSGAAKSGMPFPRSDDRAIYATACALQDCGRSWEAHRLFCELRDRGFIAPGLVRRVGWCLLAMGYQVESEQCMREAVAIEPD